MHYYSNTTKNILSPVLSLVSHENKSFKILLPFDNVPDHLKALMELVNETDFFFNQENTSILQFVGQKIISTFSAYYLRTVTNKRAK